MPSRGSSVAGRFAGRTAMAALALVLLAPDGLLAQGRQATPPAGYRKLAPGVETTISPQYDPEDTVTRHDVAEIQAYGDKLKWTPQTQAASETLGVLTNDIPFRRDAWYLEFSFLPLRMMYVDFPRPDGTMDRKMVWYMVYRVKNIGGHSRPVKNNNGEWETKPVDDITVRFFPQFILEGKDRGVEYLDRVLPLAVDAIENREDLGRELLNSVEISNQAIPLSADGDDKSVWGVATWVDVDPQIDLFSIYVKGLTSAYRFENDPNVKPDETPGKGRTYKQKTLKLNFWRPGDEFFESEREIYMGVPKGVEKGDDKGKVDYEWVFR